MPEGGHRAPRRSSSHPWHSPDPQCSRCSRYLARRAPMIGAHLEPDKGTAVIAVLDDASRYGSPVRSCPWRAPPVSLWPGCRVARGLHELLVGGRKPLRRLDGQPRNVLGGVRAVPGRTRQLHEHPGLSGVGDIASGTPSMSSAPERPAATGARTTA